MGRKRSTPQDAVLLDREPGEEQFAWRTDEFLETYVCWREECELVRIAYEQWRSAPLPDLGLAFAAYQAALDREHQAARSLAAASDRLEPAED
jgi:hypothetical protein